MIQNTVSYIYLVILTAGYSCCDQLHRTLRAFTDKGDAESYMKDARHRISRNVGLQHAVDVLMSDMWDKQHPSLPCPPNEGEGAMEAYNAWCEKDNAHRDARRAEQDRLLALVGWDATLNLHWEEEYDLHIQEVPLGFEVVASPTEVAEAAE